MGAFHNRSISDSPIPVSEVDGILSSKDLLSNSEREPMATAIVYIVWGISWSSVTNNSKAG